MSQLLMLYYRKFCTILSQYSQRVYLEVFIIFFIAFKICHSTVLMISFIEGFFQFCGKNSPPPKKKYIISTKSKYCVPLLRFWDPFRNWFLCPWFPVWFLCALFHVSLDCIRGLQSSSRLHQYMSDPMEKTTTFFYNNIILLNLLYMYLCKGIQLKVPCKINL